MRLASDSDPVPASVRYPWPKGKALQVALPQVSMRLAVEVTLD